MSELIKQLTQSLQAHAIVTEKNGKVEYHPVEGYYGNGDYWWFKTGIGCRDINWDRGVALSFQPLPQSKIFSVGRKRLMALYSQGINPKMKFMASYDTVKLLVSKKSNLVWDFSRGDSLLKLQDLLNDGRRYQVLFSEGDGNWLNTPVQNIKVNLELEQFEIQTSVTDYPMIALNTKEIQEKQLEQIYSYLTLNNTHQPEESKIVNSVAEFEMGTVDLWRTFFEKGSFITAYSAKEGKSFNYKELKLLAMEGNEDLATIEL